MKFSFIATMFIAAVSFIGCVNNDSQESPRNRIHVDMVPAILDYYSELPEVPSPTFVEMPHDTFIRYRNAIGRIESGDDYFAVSESVTDHHSIGRYQIYESIIPFLTRNYLGYEMQPWEFLVNPRVQDLVFEFSTRETFGKYPTIDDVASFWISGWSFKKASQLRTANGTTIERYTDLVDSYMNRT